MLSKLGFYLSCFLVLPVLGALFLFSCGSKSEDANYIKDLLEQGQVAQAEVVIKEMLQHDSANVEINVLYADLLLSKGDFKEAYYMLSRARDFDSTNVTVNLKLSEFHLYLRQFEKVIISANDVLKKERNNAKAYFLKGMSYKELGDTVKAFSNFQTVVEQDANYYDAFVQLGILASAKHDSTAVQYFDNALSLRPNSAEVLFNKARFYQVHGAPNKALKIYATVPEGNNFYGSSVYNSGVILYDSGKFAEASKLFQIAGQYRNAKAFFMLGLICEQAKQMKEARINYEKCLELDPTYEKAKLKLASIRN